MLTCVFKIQVNESIIEIVYWNLCISFTPSVPDLLSHLLISHVLRQMYK